MDTCGHSAWDYGSEGWGFESLRARWIGHAEMLVLRESSGVPSGRGLSGWDRLSRVGGKGQGDGTRTGGRGPLRRRIRCVVAALAVVAAPTVISVGPANAQVPAELDLAKSVSQPTAAPGEDVIFFLSYSCTSLTEPCIGATVTDTLPPELSRAAADVQFGGNFADVTYNPTTGTALFLSLIHI